MTHHRSGKKFAGSHTTYTDLAAEVADIAARIPEIKSISAGLIQSGKGVSGGIRKVKITKMQGGLLLQVRQSRSVQDVRVFTSFQQDAMLALSRALRDNDIPICFT